MEKKKQNPLLLGICIALNVFHFAMEMYLIVYYSNILSTVIWVAVSCISLLILYYILVGYKKPHGNMLRYLMLAFAVTMLFDVASFADVPAYAPLRAGIILLIGYVAGRLDKIDQNKVLMPIVLAMIIVSGFIVVKAISTQNIIINIICFMDAVMWGSMYAAYFVRYKEHKEAGLIDAPKN